MLRYLWLFIYVLMHTCLSYAGESTDEDECNEVIQQAYQDIGKNVEDNFGHRSSSNPGLKLKLYTILHDHVASQLKETREFLADMREKIGVNDLANLEYDFDNHRHRISAKNDFCCRYIGDNRKAFKKEYGTSVAKMKKYERRLKESLKFAESEIKNTISSAQHTLLDNIEYRELAKLHTLLVEKGLINVNRYYLKEQKAKTGDGTCTICMEKSTQQNPLIRLTGCYRHRPVYCRSCVRDYIRTLVKERPIWSILCPDSKCKRPLNSCDILRLFKLKQAGAIMRNSLRSLQLTSKAFFICPNDRCQPSFAVRETGEKVFQCTKCSKRYCFDCGSEDPVGNSCTWHNAGRDIHDLVTSRVIQVCTRCGHGVVRVDGCENITCRCGQHLRYHGEFQELGRNNWNHIQSKLHPNDLSYLSTKQEMDAMRLALDKRGYDEDEDEEEEEEDDEEDEEQDEEEEEDEDEEEDDEEEEEEDEEEEEGEEEEEEEDSDDD